MRNPDYYYNSGGGGNSGWNAPKNKVPIFYACLRALTTNGNFRNSILQHLDIDSKILLCHKSLSQFITYNSDTRAGKGMNHTSSPKEPFYHAIH